MPAAMRERASLPSGEKTTLVTDFLWPLKDAALISSKEMTEREGIAVRGIGGAARDEGTCDGTFRVAAIEVPD